MEPTTKQDFYKGIDSQDVENTGTITLVWVFLCLYLTLVDLVGFLSRSSDTLSGVFFDINKKWVVFPDQLSVLTCNDMTKCDQQNHTAMDKLIERYLMIAYNEIEKFFGN